MNQFRKATALSIALLLLMGTMAGCERRVPRTDTVESSSSLAQSAVREPVAIDPDKVEALINEINNSDDTGRDFWYLGKPFSITLSYDSHTDQQKLVKAPIPAVEFTDGDWNQFCEEGFGTYITKEKTVIIGGGQPGGREATTWISLDQGSSWEIYPTGIPDAYLPAAFRIIGFTSGQDGWLLLGGGNDKGERYHFVFVTKDGGKHGKSGQM